MASRSTQGLTASEVIALLDQCSDEEEELESVHLDGESDDDENQLVTLFLQKEISPLFQMIYYHQEVLVSFSLWPKKMPILLTGIPCCCLT